jgi:uncharacterized membrane protein HdeD (DUF308 family)
MQTFGSSSLLGEARRYWQMSLVRGILAIIAGLIIVCWPGQSFVLFFYVFGAFAIVEGCVMAANGFRQMSAAKTSQVGGGAGTYFQSSARPQEGQSYREREAGAGTSYQGVRPQEPAYQRPLSPTGSPAAYQSAASEAGGTLGQGTSVPQGRESYLTKLPYLNKLSRQSAGTQAALGIASIICGILCLILPSFIGALVVYAVAAWAMFRGISGLMHARERGGVHALIGVLAIILSLFLFIDPFGAIRTFLWGVGVFAIIMGVIMVMRGLKEKREEAHPTPPLEPTY